MILSNTNTLLSSFDKIMMYKVFAICTALGAIASILLESYLPFLLPIVLLGIGILYTDYRRLWYILFAVIPFSIEFYFEGIGFGTDLPSEPFMIVLTGLTLITLIRNRFSLPKEYVIHPIFILINIHVFWIFLTAIQSTHLLVSIKFVMAKVWYVVPFFIFPLLIVKDSETFIKIYKLIFWVLLSVIGLVVIRHAFEGFSFTASYDVVRPFFRNHVTYAAISVICLPFVWAFYQINKHRGLPVRFMMFSIFIFVIGIYFSYTRAAILSMVFAVGAYYIVKYRKVGIALLLSSFIAVVGIIFLSWNNKYLDFAPNFEKTITHTEFDNLLEATYKLEDISSMERVYRWIAGVEMIKDRFWLGFGPGTFFSNYKSYSISRFQTYVSDNPDKSGIHNYYLMTWVEQGFIGFVLLILLCFTILFYGESIYHRATDVEDKALIMASVLSFIVIFSMCLINDLLETDKVGPFFFLNAAIILFYYNKYKVVPQNPID